MKLLPHVEPGHRLLLSAMLGSFVLFGLSITPGGAVMPQMIREFNWSYTTVAIVLYASALGYFMTTFASGLLIGRLGPRKVIVGGMLIQAVGLGLFGITDSVWINAGLKLLSGIGLAGTEVVVNLGVVRMERGGQGRLMNLMHGMFAAGAVASPAAVWLIARAGLPWQGIFRLTGALSLVMAVLMMFAPFSRLAVPAGPGLRLAGVLSVLRNPLVVLGSLILMIYVGVEIGITDWVAEYCVVELGMADAQAATLVSLFWLGLLAGRIGVSVLYHGTRHERLLLSMTLTTLAAIGGVLLARSPVGVAVAVFVAGLGLSAIYPVVMTLLGRYVHDAQPIALSAASTGGGAGGLVFPFAIATTAGKFGIATGFALSAVLAGVMLVLVMAMAGAVRRAHEN